MFFIYRTSPALAAGFTTATPLELGGPPTAVATSMMFSDTPMVATFSQLRPQFGQESAALAVGRTKFVTNSLGEVRGGGDCNRPVDFVPNLMRRGEMVNLVHGYQHGDDQGGARN